MAAAVVSHPPLAARRGAGARSWWAKAWARAVEEAAYAEEDLRAGRTLARGGHVGGISVGAGRLVAAVSDATGLYGVECRVPVLDEPALEALVEVVAAESGRVGALLDRQLPHGLVEHAEEAGVELLPYGGELEAACTCEAWLDPCPHALALLTQAGWLVDDDPLLLLHLRGLDRDDLLARLHGLGPAEGPEQLDAVDLDTALDAALRAARALELLEAGRGVDHLL